MTEAKKIEGLYIATFALLAAHEIDAAYWHEWNLFGVPGGIQLFLILNFPLLVPFLHGLAQLARGRRAGVRFALALSVVGLAVFCAHAWLLALGHPEFRLPVSEAILGLALMTSLVLGWLSIKALRRSVP